MHTLNNYIAVAVLIFGFFITDTPQAATSVSMRVSVAVKIIDPLPQTNIDIDKFAAMADGKLNELGSVTPSIGDQHVKIHFKKTTAKTRTGVESVLQVLTQFL